MSIKKIALGTAQFGLKYGIANKRRKLAKKEVFSILEFAYNQGIDILDTAYSYGESEKIIGEFILQSKKRFNIISKLPNLGNNETSKVETYCQMTLRRLNQEKIYGYLIHRFDNILMYEDLWDKLESLKQKELVSKIGVSLYRTEELKFLLNSNNNLDVIQVPYNIFDQRFEEYFPILRKRAIEIHTRSVFLQGLFFLETDRINKYFQSAKNMINKLKQISASYEIPMHSLCLCFVMLNPLIDKVVIGVDSMENLEQNLSFMEYLDKTKNIYKLLKSLKFHNEKVILPYNWK